ncbi:MAG: NADPH:quinone oxidoreductase family protein [Acidimicrobiales bacterium]|nr:NADPH:quinone oxidoreductase family protein [Acidimicrobiales bacterium]
MDDTFRAWRVHELGDPADVLQLDEVVSPVPGAGQLLVQVEACGLNFADDLLCRGTYQEHPPLPFTPGMEVAGTVLATGPACSVEVGQRVLAAPVAPHGGLAERTLVDERDAFGLPDHVGSVTAAAMLVTYQSAWVALFRRGGLRAGETLVVHAGAGGVGSAAIQLGRAAGATVIATAGGADKTEVCRRLGADLVVDYRVEDVVEAVKAATDGRGADVIFDPVGGDTFDASRRCIAWEGRLLVVGFASGRIPEAPANHVLVKNYSVVGVHWGGYRTRLPDVLVEAHTALMDLLARGAVEPLVSRLVALEDVPAALRDLTGRGTVGKLVVTPWTDPVPGSTSRTEGRP